jgi:Family of unknown function (DUF6152)
MISMPGIQGVEQCPPGSGFADFLRRMQLKKLILGLAAVAAFAFGSAFAHHSFAMFDGQKLVILKGEILSFSNMNPHAWISVQASVDGKGNAERWDIEATSPGTLATQGISPETLKTGDKVTIAMRPLRDGRRGGSFVFVVTADGTSRGAKPEALGLDVATLKPE